MAEFGATQLTGNVETPETTKQSVDPNNSGQANEPTPQTDLANAPTQIPAKPKPPADNRIQASHQLLGEHVESPRESNTESNFRQFMKLGWKNVNGWWRVNGWPNYVRKCITDIPKGLIQGVLTGFGTGMMLVLASPIDKLIDPQNSKETVLAHFWDLQKHNLQVEAVAILTNDNIERISDPKDLLNRNQVLTGKKYLGHDINKIDQGVKQFDVTYTPTKMASFGIGAAVGAAVPTVLAGVLFGPFALAGRAIQSISGKNTTNQNADTLPSNVGNEQGTHPPQVNQAEQK